MLAQVLELICELQVLFLLSIHQVIERPPPRLLAEIECGCRLVVIYSFRCLIHSEVLSEDGFSLSELLLGESLVKEWALGLQRTDTGLAFLRDDGLFAVGTRP